MSRIGLRVAAAWNAFLDVPPDRYLVVEWVDPIGWCILHEFDEYHDAYIMHTERYPQSRNVRVMAETEWRRRTVERMATREPWVAMAQICYALDKVHGELEDERAIHRAGLIGSLAEPKYP